VIISEEFVADGLLIFPALKQTIGVNKLKRGSRSGNSNDTMPDNIQKGRTSTGNIKVDITIT
jgi:hypothetical protein